MPKRSSRLARMFSDAGAGADSVNEAKDAMMLANLIVPSMTEKTGYAIIQIRSSKSVFQVKECVAERRLKESVQLV